MNATIHQPNFLAYLGLFHKIKQADLFVVYDVAQYVRDRFDNRNQIKGANGVVWLTVPVQVKDSFKKRFIDVLLPPDQTWKKKHLRTLEMSYARTPYFKTFFPRIEEIYRRPHERLSELSTDLILLVMEELRITTKVTRSSELGLDLELQSSEMLIEILQKVGASDYLAGPSGRKYMDMPAFERAGIRCEFQHFTHPVYSQPFGEFVPNLAAIDLVFNEGERAGDLI